MLPCFMLLLGMATEVKGDHLILEGQTSNFRQIMTIRERFKESVQCPLRKDGNKNTHSPPDIRKKDFLIHQKPFSIWKSNIVS